MTYKIPALLLALLTTSVPALWAQDHVVTRMSEVTTTAAVDALREELPVDYTGRPEWTSRRRFATTRVYIQKAPWEVGAEQWWRFRSKRDGSSESRMQEEVEIGLPGRLQLDIYETWKIDERRHARHDYLSFELRYALADWGKIWGNPTVYGEYKIVDEGADVYELKLLLGDELAKGVHWALNAVWEKQVGDDRESEFQVVGGLSWSVVDEVFSVGLEAKYVYFTARDSRGEPEQSFLIGPSIQFRPTSNTHLDLVGLIGTNDDSPRFEGYLVFGVEFGRVGGSSGGPEYAPVSVRSN